MCLPKPALMLIFKEFFVATALSKETYNLNFFGISTKQETIIEFKERPYDILDKYRLAVLST